MARKLKVFRTAAGFHDAYVAAASRTAALAAWGATADLFARGAAEEVTDAALMAEPLAHPGEVIKRSRGSAAEQFAALPVDAPRATPKRGAGAASAPDAAPAPRPRKPDRAALDAAEEALAVLDRAFRTTQRELARRQADLDRERRDAIAAHEREAAELEQARAAAKAAYDAALDRWRR